MVQRSEDLNAGKEKRNGFIFSVGFWWLKDFLRRKSLLGTIAKTAIKAVDVVKGV